MQLSRKSASRHLSLVWACIPGALIWGWMGYIAGDSVQRWTSSPTSPEPHHFQLAGAAVGALGFVIYILIRIQLARLHAIRNAEANRLEAAEKEAAFQERTAKARQRVADQWIRDHSGT